MNPFAPSIRVASALALAAALAGAQSAPRVKALPRPPGPLRSVHYDLSTGTLSRRPSVNDRSATSVTDFYNLDGAFVGVDSGAGTREWWSAAVKGYQGNASDLMSEIVFAYCTDQRGPAVGGPGGSVRLGFYEGYQVFGGVPTTAVSVFTLTGLPASTVNCSFACFFITVQFRDLVAFADGPIGYSWRWIGTSPCNPALSGTYPFLACVVSCSGALLQVDGQGMTDVIDVYSPPGTLLTSFTFGTSGGTFTSLGMAIREARDLPTLSSSYNATLTPNPDILSATPGVIGSTWSATITRPAPTAPGNFTVVVKTTRLAGNGVPAPPLVGRLLIGGTTLGMLTGTHDGTTGTVSTPMPARMSLLCKHFVAQAVIVAGNAALSSAVEGTTGTF